VREERYLQHTTGTYSPVQPITASRSPAIMAISRSSLALALALVLLARTCTPVSAGWGPGKCAKAAAKISRKGCTPPPSWLFVQTASSCHIDVTPSGLALVLSGVASSTTAFTDRPVRSASTVRTATFDGSFAADFGDDSPNAALAGLRQDEVAQRSYVVQLADPSYDEEAGTLTYIVQQSTDQQATGVVSTGLTMDTCSLFIE